MMVAPCSIKAANTYVAEHHRHHKPVHGALWAVRCVDDNGNTVGVAIVGRPVSRMLDDGHTAEIVRVATNGERNACSLLYGACRRAAKALGYASIVTYILDSEPGDSLRGAGFLNEGLAGGGDWSRPSRKRTTEAPRVKKQRWAVRFTQTLAQKLVPGHIDNSGLVRGDLLRPAANPS